MPRAKGGPKVAAPKVDYEAVKDILIPYRRVSTREQADSGAGLEAQKTSIRFGLEMRQETALHWDCVDKGKSGKDLKRAQLTEALSLVEQGVVGGIVVSKLDRLSRSLLDFAFLMTRALSEGWNLVILDIGVDLRTPAGKAMASMLATFAEFERDMISVRTKDGLAEKRAQGVILGRPSNISPGLLKVILRQYQAQGSFSGVARWLNESGVPTAQGGKKWYPAVVQKLVQSPAAEHVLMQRRPVPGPAAGQLS